MSNTLIEKLRKSREVTVEVHGHNFTIRRPSQMAIVQHNKNYVEKNEIRLDLLKRSVVNWDLKESDLINGGTPDLVEFHSDLFVEWLEDNSKFWDPLTEALFEQIDAFYSNRSSAEKN